MKDIKIKSFILPKEPGSDVCQDSLSVNLKRGRFAVADGVTNSNHPEIIARLLSEAFVVEEIAIEDWPTVFEEKALEKICKDWKEEEESIFSSLTGRKRSQAQLRRDYYSPGASTLAGIEIDKDKRALRFLILGDSTLFVIGSDGTYFAVNSDANCSKRGLLLPFNNTPGTVVANGKVNGQWVSGQCNLQEGYVALMTDGCANWFQETYANDTSIIEKLWELKDNGEFATFVEGVWAQQPKYEDDWALILIKLENEEYEMTYFPDGQVQALFVKDDEPNLIGKEGIKEKIDDGRSVDKDKGQEYESGEEVETVVSQEAKGNQPEDELLTEPNIALSPMERLNKMSGIDNIREQFERYRALFKLYKERGIKFNRHMVFMGNSGTGKTTVARLFGEILHDDGLLSQGQFVQATMDDMIGHYIGETRVKTSALCERARGGVLFINEVHGLMMDYDYRWEAIEALIQFMMSVEDTVVILAGRPEMMMRFLDYTGIGRHFFSDSQSFFFKDYETDVLFDILLNNLSGHEVSDDFKTNVQKIIKYEYEHRDEKEWGNARTMEIFAHDIYQNYLVRHHGKGIIDTDCIPEQLGKLINTEQNGGKELLEDDQTKEDLKDEITPIKDEIAIRPLEESASEELQTAENHEEVDDGDLEEMSEKEPIVVTEVPNESIKEAAPHQEGPVSVSETDNEDKDNQDFDRKYDDNTNK